jgi:ATP-binding cassette subfamily F protein 3
MSVLNVTGLRKILGSQEILRGADLRIERGEKVGCVGRNGEGKTTLLRLIEGEEHADGGQVQVSRGSRVGYVLQRPDFGPGTTVRAYVESGLEEVHALEAELERLGQRMAEVQGEELDALVKQHGERTARMDFLGGWEADRRVETVLSGIGLARELWEREARTLSGGEKSRAALARELVSVPDLLLLDEPTNHLDLVGIEWLEDYLDEIASAVLIVSHDRRLLDRVVDSIVELERGLIVRYGGNYSTYLQRKAERYDADLKAWQAQQDHVRREEAYIRKHMGSQNTAEAKGRRRRLQGLERLPRPYHDVRRPVIRMGEVERGGEQVVEALELSIGYDGKPLIENARVRIGRGERIGLVGANGTGKTTLLKVLAGRMEPLAGTITRGYRAACGYYDQEVSDLLEDGTPFTEIRRDHPQMTDQEIRNHLARFLFRGKDVDLEVKNLSGGERARLSIARLVLSGPSWLALDEPTNHLDLPARTALEEMLSEFPGSLVCVSHDRAFLDSLVHTIVEVADGTVRTFRGNYSDYRATKEREETAAREEAEARATRARAQEKPAPAAEKRSKRTGSRGAKKGNPWRLEKLEKAIIALEEERESLLAALGTEEVYRDPSSARETQVRLAELERDLEEKNLEWERYAG